MSKVPIERMIALAPPPESKGPLIWWTALVSAICFEGLGRKFIPSVPAPFFYYLKDIVLLLGLMAFGLRRDVLRFANRTMGAYGAILTLAFAWSVLEVFNPKQTSFVLAMVGMKAYWGWWLAPLVIASVVRTESQRRAATHALVWVTLVVAAFAFFQFAAPAESAINQYALYQGSQVLEVAKVGSTGKARVSSTFSYLVGFTDYIVLIPGFLVAIGITERVRRRRMLGLAAAGLCLASAFTSGSRGPIILAAFMLFFIARGAGFLLSESGRRVIGATLAAAALALVFTPDAVVGVSDRFSGDDTSSRLRQVFEFLPPYSMATLDYPFLGEGTGTQQNVRTVFGVRSDYLTESEATRLLVELGPAGYLLMWLSKIGLAHALLRLSRRLKRSGEGALSGVAIAYAGFTMLGNFAFDHVWQALLMTGIGFLLSVALSKVQNTVGRPA